MKITSMVFIERRHCIQETRRYIIQENVPKLKSLGFQTESTQVSKNSRKPYKCTCRKISGHWQKFLTERKWVTYKGLRTSMVWDFSTILEARRQQNNPSESWCWRRAPEKFISGREKPGEKEGKKEKRPLTCLRNCKHLDPKEWEVGWSGDR